MINHAKSYVTSKNIKVFKPWYKQISANSNLPYGIKTRETVKGFSGNKGNFVIISYKDKDGNILQKVISYPDRNEVTTKDFTYDDILTYVHTQTTQNGISTKNEYKTLRRYDNGCCVELTEKLGNNPAFDVQKARYLKPKQNPKEINVEEPWWKPKITSPNCTVGRMCLLRDISYLPTVISNFSKERTNERIKSIEHVLSLRNNMTSSRTCTERVTQKSLNPKNEPGEIWGDCNQYGKVRIWDELYTTPDLYEAMGHEFDHSKVFDILDKLEANNTKGLGFKKVFTAKKIMDEFKDFENIPYKERTIERLAFIEEAKVRKKFFDMFDNIVNFFER